MKWMDGIFTNTSLREILQGKEYRPLDELFLSAATLINWSMGSKKITFLRGYKYAAVRLLLIRWET